MGLPQEQPQTAQRSQPDPSTSTTKPTTLPPEALSLATKLFDYARAGSTAPLAQYLTAGIPANLTNHKGDTLLMLAAYHGHVDTVSMLLDHGADANVLNERGQSPVAGAVFKGYEGVVRVLVERGGVDLEAGRPNAVEAARMFRREGMLALFGVGE
ncbi:hypothetical protein M409DRAFT_16681 [Zasmidium cellare ATCC 36951]|uniref:Uncharacterized protein n=1 Tax=Zasmidium cellare ATCC 36951 TaxID=1080233 RepID=A0A6A6D3L1_ZASCE|nr:uncharacterized protein M409DRAFT_16681 [Zasmidium cellare ATCC 36951]KAF2172719.1 hypothetical protein M409DRAFT_16681 [Zasmidium cellare ATCC 36951]